MYFLGIIVKGEFVCFDSITELKKKFGNGYIIKIKKADGHDDEKLDFYMTQLCQNIKRLKTSKNNFVEYQIPYDEFSFYQTFLFLEHEMIEKEIISDFGVNQPSLESIFIQFAQHNST